MKRGHSQHEHGFDCFSFATLQSPHRWHAVRDWMRDGNGTWDRELDLDLQASPLSPKHYPPPDVALMMKEGRDTFDEYCDENNLSPPERLKHADFVRTVTQGALSIQLKALARLWHAMGMQPENYAGLSDSSKKIVLKHLEDFRKSDDYWKEVRQDKSWQRQEAREIKEWEKKNEELDRKAQRRRKERAWWKQRGYSEPPLRSAMLKGRPVWHVELPYFMIRLRECIMDPLKWRLPPYYWREPEYHREITPKMLLTKLQGGQLRPNISVSPWSNDKEFSQFIFNAMKYSNLESNE